MLVKHWAKRRNVAEAYKGCLSSYCYVLMCIYCCQQQQPPIVPNLQREQPLVVNTYDMVVNTRHHVYMLCVSQEGGRVEGCV